MGINHMTEAEIKLEDDKMRAEIANLNALTAKLIAETSKINAEALKVYGESRWYPLAIGTGFAGVLLTAGVALAKLFFGA